MRSHSVALPLLAAALLTLTACGDDDEGGAATTPTTAAPGTVAPVTEGPAAGPITVIGPAEGAELMLQMADGLTVIDVRTAEEFAAGHVEGAVNYDVEGGQFTALIEGLDRNASYLVYCHSGRRSALAAQAMADAGFTTIYDMGGIQAWVEAGLPLVTG